MGKCHPGLTRTMHFLRQQFWWPSMIREARTFVTPPLPISACGKSSHQPLAGFLQPLSTPRHPWSHFTPDFLTGLLPSKGNTVIMTVGDRFSRSTYFVPLPKLPSVVKTGKLLVQHIFRLHSIPKDIVSDRGPQFASFTSCGGPFAQPSGRH